MKTFRIESSTGLRNCLSNFAEGDNGLCGRTKGDAVNYFFLPLNQPRYFYILGQGVLECSIIGIPFDCGCSKKFSVNLLIRMHERDKCITVVS